MVNSLFGNQSNEGMLAALKSGGRFPHCIILSGSIGSGKRSFAFLIAAAYLCSQNISEDKLLCGSCNDCRLALEGHHPDVTLITAPEDSKTGAITIEQIRELKRTTALKPNQGIGRVFILKDAHLMQESAANALLKQIEEPVKGVIYILLCESEQLLPETVRSRGVIMQMPVLTAEQCIRLIKVDFPNHSEEEIRTLSIICSGSIGAIKAALNDPETGELLKCCGQVITQMERYNGFAIAVLLKAYEAKRPQYLRLLTTLRLYMAAEMRNPQSKIDVLRLVTAMDDLQMAIDRCKQNVVLSMLSAVLSAKLTQRS